MSKGCTRLLAFIIGLIFIIATVVALFLYHVEYTFVQPETYIRALEEGDFASQLTSIASQELSGALTEDPCLVSPDLCARAGGPPDFLVRLTESDWEQILDLLITPEWIRDQSEVILRGVFQLFDPESAETTLLIDFRPVKDRLGSETGTEILEILIGTLPTCTPEQIADLTLLLLTGGNIEDLLVCSPPAQILNQSLPILNRQLLVIVLELPDQIAVEMGGVAAGLGPETVNTIMQGRRMIRQGTYLTAAIAFVSLILVLIIAVRSLRDFFIWIGWPILMVGLVVLALSLLAQGSTNLLFQYLLASLEEPTLQPGTIEFISELFQAVVRSIFRGMTVFAAAVSIAGVGMLLLSLLFPPSNRQTEVGRRPNNLY